MIFKYSNLVKKVEKELNIKLNIFYLDSYGLYVDIFKGNDKIVSNFNIANNEEPDYMINSLLKDFLNNEVGGLIE